MKPIWILALTAAGVAGATTVAPDVMLRVPGEAPQGPVVQQEVPQYDGRYTFVRVQFGERQGLQSFVPRRRRSAVWAHDYPRADLNFLKILDATTLIDVDVRGKVLRMDDPDVFNYPALYVVEVGYWPASDEEVEALGAYLQKGGFLIVDDFRDNQIYNIRDILLRAVPNASLAEIPDDHEIWNSFFKIEEPRSLTSYGWYPPTYLGLFENGDTTGPVMAILNYNGDIAEYWEYADYGYTQIDINNEAFKFGVNYVVYAMTH